MLSRSKHPLIIYLLKFLLVFGVLYYGTFIYIGLTAPGGYYVPFFDHYLNYPAWLRLSLMVGAQGVLKVFGYSTTLPDDYIIRVTGGAGVHIGYSCLGYGIFSFWSAFVFANKGSWQRKTKWILGGLLAIWFINVLRISLLLASNSQHKPMPLGIDHHTWFNMVAYVLVFVMICLYDAYSAEGKVFSF